MYKYIGVIIIAIILSVSFDVQAQDDQAIMQEIKQHREAITQLEQQLGDDGMQGEYEDGGMAGNEEGYTGSEHVMPDKANVDRPWEKAADLNNDGVVDQTEIRQWNNKKANRQGDPKVNKPWEGKADLNNDGVVDKQEKQKWNNRKPNKKGTLPDQSGASPKYKKLDNPPGPKGGLGAGNPNLNKQKNRRHPSRGPGNTPRRAPRSKGGNRGGRGKK